MHAFQRDSTRPANQAVVSWRVIFGLSSAMSGTRLDVDLTTGTGQMQGRVRTILQPGGN